MTKTVSPTTVVVGGTVTWSIGVTNRATGDNDGDTDSRVDVALAAGHSRTDLEFGYVPPTVDATKGTTNGAGTSDEGSLPFTGGDPYRLVMIGFGALVIGACLWRSRIRRSA